VRAALLALAVIAATGCGSDPDYLTVDELMDPDTCKDCHPKHYREWSGSMHAYAADDPVFLAMNQRGQEETDGALGDFCVGCHAPMAVEMGLTTDGLNLDEIEQKYKGVTCYFCHNVVEVQDDHNNPLVLAMDDVMRGGIADPVNAGHRTELSPLHSSRSDESSSMCGSCHDIVTPAGVHLERTFQEWKDSVFNKPIDQGGLSCGNCHMPITPGTAADVDGVPLRDVREHTFVGVDVAITDWPEKEAQLAGIARDLFGAVLPKLCVTPAGGGFSIEYNLDNVFAGHSIPSGAAQDRRMWVELTALRGTDVILETGVVAAGQPVAEVAETDANLWQIRDFNTDDSGDEAHMFWDVREVRSELLPPGVTNDQSDPRFNHSVSRFFEISGEAPTRVEARVYIRPIGLDVLDDLIGSGHLDAAFRSEIPTMLLEGTELVWTEADGLGCVDRRGGR
jgi:hypothetical protein